MAYTKTVWKDQDVENPRTYTMRDNGDDTVTLLDAFGTVTELGTPVNAANMNHIENGIYDVDNSAAHKTGTETITGQKTFYNSTSGGNLLQSTGATTSGSYVDFVQQINGARRGTMRTRYESNGSYSVVFGCNGPQADAPTGITVNRDTNNVTTVTAPTPTDTISTSSNQTATVGWVNGSGNNVVHKTGNETISGTKTFQGTGWTLYVKNTNVTYNTAPSSDTTTAIAFVDKNSQNMGIIDCFRLTDNSTMMQFNIYGRNGSWAARPLEFKIHSNGKESSYAPASDEINSIVTTVNKSKSKNGYFKLGNGLIVQWGYSSASGEDLSITFPTPFSSTNYGMGLTVNSDYGGSIWISEMSVTNRSTTGFTYGNSSKTRPFSWVAIGY